MKKRYLIVGVIIIFMIGVISVVASDLENKPWTGHKGKYGGCEKDTGCPHKYYDSYDKSAWFEKMGLSEDATEEEIMAVKKTMWRDKEGHWFKEKKAEYAIIIREKLGLSENATDEEVKVAMQELKGEWGFHSKEGKDSSWCNNKE